VADWDLVCLHLHAAPQVQLFASVDGCIICCSIISSWQSTAISEIAGFQVSSAISSTQRIFIIGTAHAGGYNLHW